MKAFKALLSGCLVLLTVGTVGGVMSPAVIAVKPDSQYNRKVIGTTFIDGKEYYVNSRTITSYHLTIK